MTCVVHSSLYRHHFHAVVNELRKEKRLVAQNLRNMPSKCCACHGVDDVASTTPEIREREKLVALKMLVDRIERDQTNDPKLGLSLKKIEIFIANNQTSDSNDAMDTTEPNDSHKKDLKPLKSGVFLYLPYSTGSAQSSSPISDSEKRNYIGRFIGQKGFFPKLEQQYNVRINMLTSETKLNMNQTLEKAKAGRGKVKIHNPLNSSNDANSFDDGEWVLIRRMNNERHEDGDSFDEVLNTLRSRWDTMLIGSNSVAMQEVDE